MKKILSLFIVSCLLIACNNHSKSDSHQLKTYVLKPEVLHKSLHFVGIIQPLRETALTSPMNAVVETMNYRYGQMVNKDDIVFTLNSPDLQKQYNEILTDYLKAKDSFSVANAKFSGTQDLWNAGLLAKNSFLSEKSSLDTAHVSLIQATRKLTEMLEKMDEENIPSLSALNLAEFDKVQQVLNSQHNLIHLKAPNDGILLYPPKAGEDKNTRVSVGSNVKAGQVLALVGDIKGISVEIDIPEIDIDKVHSGMKATITGVALGKHILNGELVSVNAQATDNNSNTLPSFNAVVTVKNLSAKQRAVIKIGMSANIELVIESKSKLLIPIAAIKQEKDQSIVMVKTAKSELKKQQITTGAAQADRVVVNSGLQEGDVITYE